MCGIVGVLNLTNQSPISPDCLRRANDSLYHRGPDDEGVFVEAGFGMAMRRLSIIDLAHGHQPMSNEDGTVHIVYNGEVYNHSDLRTELEALGHTFRTSADTEVVLHGYEQWGHEGILARLRGMFAFAIWNSAARTLFLARDRMGIKPLYYAEHDGRFYFASEIRALLLHSRMPRRTNLPALDVFMKFGFVTSPNSMFEGVHKVPPAHYMSIEKGHISTREYWALSYEVTHRGSEAAIVDEFRGRLEETIRAHLMSDVPLGALLSGGVDSTATVAFMRRVMKAPVRTITLGFEAEDFDEAEWAAASARELGTEHRSITFTGDTMDTFPDFMYFQEEPTRPTQVALYQLFKVCRENGLKVVITGEGADELLGGYAWHRMGLVERTIARLPEPLRAPFERSPALLALSQGARSFQRRRRGLPTAVHRVYQGQIRNGRLDPRYLLSTEAKSTLDDHAAQSILDSWADWLPNVRNRPEFDQVLWLQSRTRMVDYINHGLDRMSMAHSVEARPPFLDHTLWEFCASVPTGFKMRHSVEKYLLRKAGENVIPEPARVRRKKPLEVPYMRWIAKSSLPDWAETALSEPQLRKTALFDPVAVQGLRREVQAGARHKANFLMGVLTTQTWAHMFLESTLVPG